MKKNKNTPRKKLSPSHAWLTLFLLAALPLPVYFIVALGYMPGSAVVLAMMLTVIRGDWDDKLFGFVFFGVTLLLQLALCYGLARVLDSALHRIPSLAIRRFFVGIFIAGLLSLPFLPVYAEPTQYQLSFKPLFQLVETLQRQTRR